MDLYTKTTRFEDFPHCQVSPDAHAKRKKITTDASKSMLASIEDVLSNSYKLESIQQLDYRALVFIAEELAAQGAFALGNDPRWKDRLFGAVNTIEKSACVAFTGYNLLTLAGKDYFDNFLDFVDLVVKRGYRQWRYTKLGFRDVLDFPEDSLDTAMLAFPESREILNCESLDELHDIVGEPVGIGGSAYFIDEAIAFYSADHLQVEAYQQTRLWTFEQVLACLDRACAVPLRLQGEKEGHYVLLIGIHDGCAILVDNSVTEHGGLAYMPIKQFLEAIIGRPDYTTVWDASMLWAE